MFRFTAILRSLLLPLAGALALGLAGCPEKGRLSYATEVDEPNYREGQALLKSGRKQEALSAFLKVIDKRIDDAPESHLEVGLLYLQHINDPLSAIYHFKKYLTLRPNSPQAPLVKQRIAAATREFARTLPAQPLESQLQRVDLVATLDRLKQENESLKQQLADLKAGRNSLTATVPEDTTSAAAAPSTAVNFSLETMPVVRTRPPPVSPVRAPPAPARTSATPAQTKPAPAAPSRTATGVRKHTVQPGDTLSKLAQQYYGNRAKWRDIFAANRDVMKSEADLKVGQELRIP
ncbi:MAG: LysM peptidoglycan-binding domain-containing protein [Lacunisphaera sp.]|nr:LysM peptidoglycan-binding domain-containing protein [Lacunisphaera sp.]